MQINLNSRFKLKLEIFLLVAFNILFAKLKLNLNTNFKI